MKIDELSKSELVTLLTLLCKRCKDEFKFYHTINEFLMERWQDKFKELMGKQDKIDILADFPKWEKLSQKIDELYTDEKIKYYCNLDELKSEEDIK